MTELSLYLFGAPRLEYHKKRVVIERKKALALLAYLALSERPQGRDILCSLLWPEQDSDHGRKALRNTLSTLTTVVADDWLEKSSGTLALKLKEINVDVCTFVELISRCRSHEHPAAEVCEACVTLLNQAVDLYHSDFLAGFSLPECDDFDGWQAVQREWLRRELSHSLERLVIYYREHQEFEGAFMRAYQWLNLDPLHEPAHRELMRLYSLTGRRTEAFRQYQQCVELLDTELATGPDDETVQLYRTIQSSTSARPSTETWPSIPTSKILPGPNPPASTTSFVGRRHEIEEVKQLLRTSRLLTLTGTGGTGKTRLALQVAAEAAEDFAEGVYFIDLAPLSAHTVVASAIAGVLGVIENSAEPLVNTLKRALARRTLLLLIDNFEHVIEAAPVVLDLLSVSTNLKILVTSRETLHLTGEQEYFVPPLSLPGSVELSAHNLESSEAVSLFVQRAQMTQPHFVLNDDNAMAVAQICARLDGLPLAIELAAARCKLLTPQTLLERLAKMSDNSSLSILASGSRDAPPRHRTLRDTMAWSYNLLEEDEKNLFSRLGVFRGGRSLEAIRAICDEVLSMDVLDGLASLMDKSLVQQKEVLSGEPRFFLLDMICEYAQEQLAANGEALVMYRRHAEYFVALAERAEPELRLSRYGYWCQRFELELDNLRAVLEWSLSTGDVTLGVRLAGALGMFWYGKGYHVEGIRWTQLLLERLDETPKIHHAKLLLSAGRLAWMVDLDTAIRLCVRALEVSRELGDRLQEAWALVSQGYAMMREPQAGLTLAETGLAMFREIDHKTGIAQALNIIGELARISGDDEHAKRAYEECLAICQQTGEVLRTCYNYVNLAYLAQHEGDHKHALHLLRQGLQLSRDVSSARDIANFLATFAGSIAALGQLQSAALLLGASEVALERTGAFHSPTDQPEVDRIIGEVHAQLDDIAFQAAWVRGREMVLEEAIEYALNGIWFEKK